MKSMRAAVTAIVMLFAVACFGISADAEGISSGDRSMISAGAGVLSEGCAKEGAQSVYYGSGGNDSDMWRVIGFDGNGAASSEGNIALLCAGFIGRSRYVDLDTDNNSNEYSKSAIKPIIEDYAENNLTEGERAGIMPRTLESGVYDRENTDCISGDTVKDALLWPLSTKECSLIERPILKLGDNPNWAINFWWLRSPGDASDRIARVDSWGIVVEGGIRVRDTIEDPSSVRPAFTLNKSSVVLTSAAEGGKVSGEIGENALTKVQSYEDSKWKLTIKYGHDSFTASTKQYSGDILTIDYAGAVTGDGEYISAVITDTQGAIKYYGRITKPSTAQGTISINLKDKYTAGDKIFIFNEKICGDKKTDYSSELKEVKIPEEVTIPASQSAAQPEIMDLKAVKGFKLKSSKKVVKVKWKKSSKKDLKKIKGIEIQIATDSNFTNIVKSTTAGKKKTSKKVSGLKSKAKYWVRVRTYRNDKDGKHVSKWKTKTIKVK